MTPEEWTASLNVYLDKSTVITRRELRKAVMKVREQPQYACTLSEPGKLQKFLEFLLDVEKELFE